ncbi:MULTISPECIES: ABC transporter permease [Chelatococcus]|uniref:Sulfonate transport system permease protein n=1 Tax=Chelatococcus caeni TaxID=1348468 RepID=A0A840BSF9_9HYPH|nr:MULTISPECIES: ABC transporter permease [Chelatococcus]MBB4015734.1 sulfonate transport system permease protein [Chelatococcus caeni]
MTILSPHEFYSDPAWHGFSGKAVPKPGAAERTARPLTPRRLGPGGHLFGPVLVLAIWELASLTGLLSPRLLAAPSTAVVTGYDLMIDGVLQQHFLASAERAYLGLAIGVALGLILALIAGLTRLGEATIDGLVQIKRAIPTLALIPLAILWLGIGETMKIALIVTSVLVPVYINTHAALRGIDLRYVELARTVGLSRAQFIRRVALPGALPGFFTGLRLAVTMCWTALVVLEQINTTEGIGYLMNRARDYGQTDVIVVGLVVYAVLGLVSDSAVRWWERRALAYRKVIGS